MSVVSDPRPGAVPPPRGQVAPAGRTTRSRALGVVVLAVLLALAAGWLLGGLVPSAAARLYGAKPVDDRTTSPGSSRNCPNSYPCLRGLHADDLRRAMVGRGFTCHDNPDPGSPECTLETQSRRTDIGATTVGPEGEIGDLSGSVSGARGFGVDDRGRAALHWMARAPLSTAPDAATQVDAWLDAKLADGAATDGTTTATIAGLTFELTGKRSTDGPGWDYVKLRIKPA